MGRAQGVVSSSAKSLQRGSGDQPEKLSDGTWRMWALQRGDAFTDPGHRLFAQAHAGSEQVPVEVLVREDPDGPYYGWVATGEDIPIMIYGHIMGFRMCFPYGPEAEEESGKGRAVRLTIEVLPK